LSSTQNGEIWLQKYLPTSGKLLITKYLKQNAIDYYQSYLPIENYLKVEKKVVSVFRKQAQPSSRRKERLGYAHRRSQGAIPPNF